MSLLTDLVSHWALDEASGTRNDSHGSNDLTDNNTVGSTTGKINSCADFSNGNQEYLSCASNASLQTGDIDFTFAFWVRLKNIGSWVLVGKDVDSPGNSRDYTIDVSGGNIRFYINGGVGSGIVTGAALSTATWYFIVAWHDAAANTVNVQVNNGTASSGNTSGAVPQASGAEFRIGARAYSGFQGYADAIIDEVAFWKRTLTTQERTDLYNGGNGLDYASFGGGDGDGGVVLLPGFLRMMTTGRSTRQRRSVWPR